MLGPSSKGLDCDIFGKCHSFFSIEVPSYVVKIGATRYINIDLEVIL